MVVKLIKITSSLVVVGVLGFLIANRDFTFIRKDLSVKNVSHTSELQANTNHDPENILPQPDLLSPPILQALDATKNVDEKVQAQQSSLPQQAPVKTIPSITKPRTYEDITEGGLDTVAAYRPVISPCKETMGYKIGTFDARFGISKEQFIQEVDIAGNVWGDTLGKKLFTYNENGTLTINLIYDERQAKTDTINSLAMQIENSKSTATTLRTTYEQEKVIYHGDEEQLTKESDAFQERYKIYKDKVSIYNAQGGAPRSEYDAMVAELTALKETAKSLETRRTILITYMDSINARVSRYNELVVDINSLIKQSNSLGGQEFTEGRFIPSTNTVDIFQYNNLLKLHRVITHELGHVLGINHNENVYSIMYSVNSATTTILSSQDVQDLFRVCPPR